jgi:hypothetical protein
MLPLRPPLAPVIETVELFELPLRTRLPFRYGIAEMRALPHCVIRLRVRFGHRVTRGLAADHLPPRWFRKDARQTPDEEIAELRRVVRQAARDARGESAPTVFHWWREAYARQLAWGEFHGMPPLLAHFGVTLVERALLDAACHAAGRSFHQVLLEGSLGFDPAAVHPELAGSDWRRAFPPQPLPRVFARHTVGLGDPVLEDDLDPSARLQDGLPETVEGAIAAYGHTHFKVKLSGDTATDLARLDRLHRCLRGAPVPGPFLVTLDGNEQYDSAEAFADAWERLRASPLPRDPAVRLGCVEQPLRREASFDLAPGWLAALPGRPPVIIDEADGALEDLPRALACGYAGTSHKNCKGVFKGLAHRCLLHARARGADRADPPPLLTGEDLCTLGPIALAQDLAVQATLGSASVERNGHHYFRGLSAFPESLNRALVATQPRTYRWHPGGFAALRIEKGRIDLQDLLQCPFGLPPELAVETWASPRPLDPAETRRDPALPEGVDPASHGPD